MPAIRSLDFVVRKYERVTPLKEEEYRYGVETPKQDWETETAAANTAWKEGTGAAIREDRFLKGVRKAKTAKWKKRAMVRGVPRYRLGVEDGIEDFRTGFAPFHEVIRTTTLPVKFMKGDPRNIERVREMAMALRRKKLELLGAGAS